MPFYPASGKLGVDFNNATAFSSVSATTTVPVIPHQFHLGETCLGADGSIWQYVCADSTVSAYSVVAVNQSGTCHMAVLGDVNPGSGRFLALAQCNFAPNEYGWVAVAGGGGQNNTFKVKVSGSSQPGTTLYLATTSGNLATTAAASATLKGIAIATASTTSTGVGTPVPVIMTWPKINTLGA